MNTSVLFEEYREGVLECVHMGAVCAVDERGVAFSAGDPDWRCFYRSASKPLPEACTSTSTTSTPEAKPVGMATFASDHRRHHSVTTEVSVEASWKPCSVSGFF